MQEIGGKITEALSQTGFFWQTLSFKENPFFILDIILVTIIFYWGFLFIRETKAIRIIYGILILLIFWGLGKIFQLQALNYIIKALITMILVAIPIVFQPELRGILERLGRTRLLGEYRALTEERVNIFVENLVRAISDLSSSNIGALIVIARDNNLKDYIETGELVKAKFSGPLLKTIFFPKTPLHDGAVIIVGDEIVSASSILPLAEGKYDASFGTRHKAAIGMSSITDAIVVVVSEETGQIAIAESGKLEKNLSLDALRNKILNAIRQEKNENINE